MPSKKPAKSTAKPAPKKPTRRKSKLTLAAEAAQRGLLLATLKEQGWNLTVTAETLDLTGPADVLRFIKALDLVTEYESAKARGDISPGSRRRDAS